MIITSSPLNRAGGDDVDVSEINEIQHEEERVINEGLLLCDTNCNSSGGGSGNIYLYLHCYYYFIIGFNWKLVPRNTMLLVSLNEEDRSAIKDIR